MTTAKIKSKGRYRAQDKRFVAEHSRRSTNGHRETDPPLKLPAAMGIVGALKENKIIVQCEKRSQHEASA